MPNPVRESDPCSGQWLVNGAAQVPVARTRNGLGSSRGIRELPVEDFGPSWIFTQRWSSCQRDLLAAQPVGAAVPAAGLPTLFLGVVLPGSAPAVDLDGSGILRRRPRVRKTAR